ncbi:MAG: DUF4982 domain-containing protein, partial [Treponema sp.]|nr:DUF4982 domain-containing protein [Treponema sp.]
PYWDFNEGQLIDIRSYSNAPCVEILINGKSVAKFNRNPKTMQDLGPGIQVPYEKGEITAVAYDERGKEISRDTRRSFGDATSLCIREETENESEGGLLRFFDIYTVDSEGKECENARNLISVKVCGAARLAGLDNGDSSDYDEYQSPDGTTHTRRMFSNRLLAIVRMNSVDADFTIAAASMGLDCAGIGFTKGKALNSTKLTPDCYPKADGYVPVRKIELTCTGGSQNLSAKEKEAVLSAKIYPVNASDRHLDWKALDADGIPSPSVRIEAAKDSLSARLVAEEDGQFRLTCSASNGRGHPEVLSELEFSVTGLGKKALNPYEFIYGCRCSRPADIKLSFDGGLYADEGRAVYTFDRVDFGKDGADTMTVPIFHWNDEIPLEIWDGTPDDGRVLFKGLYRAKSIYNVYSPNTFSLTRRLFGMHSISFVTVDKLSLHGFSCPKTPKARAYLYAADADSITGDSFRKDPDGMVSGIGNNVSLVFKAMDFAGRAAGSLIIEGVARSNNTIRMVITAEDGTTFSQNLEFPQSMSQATCESGGNGLGTRTYRLSGFEKAVGMTELAFIFLPGSNFDFKGFRFD